MRKSSLFPNPIFSFPKPRLSGAKIENWKFVWRCEFARREKHWFLAKRFRGREIEWWRTNWKGKFILIKISKISTRHWKMVLMNEFCFEKCVWRTFPNEHKPFSAKSIRIRIGILKTVILIICGIVNLSGLSRFFLILLWLVIILLYTHNLTQNLHVSRTLLTLQRRVYLYSFFTDKIEMCVRSYTKIFANIFCRPNSLCHQSL